MRDIALRAQKDKLLAPFVGRFLTAVHPNVLSVLALFVGLLSVVAILQEAYLVGLGIWILNRILDGLDGLVARMHEKQSDFGGYLDLLLDFVIYLTVPVAFVVVAPTGFALWSLVVLLASYVINTLSWSTLAAFIEKRRLQSANRLTSMEMPVGLIEGAETILFYTLFYLLPGLVGYTFLVMAVLVLVTAGQRVVWAYRHLRSSSPPTT